MEKKCILTTYDVVPDVVLADLATTGEIYLAERKKPGGAPAMKAVLDMKWRNAITACRTPHALRQLLAHTPPTQLHATLIKAKLVRLETPAAHAPTASNVLLAYSMNTTHPSA